jgi:FkbM family methyltransferase
MTWPSITRRLKNVRRYLPLAYSPRDSFSFAVLGIARGRFSVLGRHLFRELIVRPGLLGGLRLALNPLDPTHVAIFNEVFLDQTYDLGLVPFTPDQIFDCGGHIGAFSLLARSRYPMAHLTIFEPNPYNIEWIRRQVELNAMNIEVIEAAVSVREGKATFQDRLSYSGHLVDDATPRPHEHQPWERSNLAEQALGAPRGCYTVRVVDLSAMLSRRRPQRLLLKLDVEGEEARIIPELFDVLPLESAVFFETHHGEPEWDWAKKEFTDHGFVVERRQSRNGGIDGFALRLAPPKDATMILSAGNLL